MVGDGLRGAGLLSTPTRQRVALELRAEAELPAFAPPRVYGIRLGFRLRLGSEPTTAEVLTYEWRSDSRELGGAQHVELARGYLIRRRMAFAAIDVAALALDVALPPEERARGYAALFWHQRHMPAAAIAGVCSALRLRA